MEDLPDESLVFLLGSRYCETDRLTDIAWNLFGSRRPARRRVQAICDYVHQPHHLQLSGCPTDEDGVGGVRGAQGRVPRLRASGDRLLPLHEHSGALLHGLPRRHRHPAAVRSDGFCRLVRGLYRRPLAHVRSAEQRAADRPRADRPWTRRDGCGDQQHVRSQHARGLHGLDRRGRESAREAGFGDSAGTACAC